MPIVVGLIAILYCIIGYANLDFGSGKLPVPWLGGLVFVACIFWAASKGEGKDITL